MEVALLADLEENSRVSEGRSGKKLGRLGAIWQSFRAMERNTPPPPPEAPRVSKAQHQILHLEIQSVPRLITQRK